MKPGIVCAWCADFDPKTPAPAGHGICPRCAEKLVQAAEQKKRPA